MSPRTVGEKARSVVLRAATAVFLAHGYDHVSMEQVAEAAGMVRRTVYNLFPEGKEALFRAAVASFWAGFPRIAWDGGQNGSPREVLTAAAEAVATFWQGDEAVAFLRLAIAEVSRFPEMMRPVAAAGRLPLMAEVERYLREQARSGVLDVPVPELAMRQFFGLVCEPLLWPRVVGLVGAPTPARRKKTIESAVSIFLKGLGYE